MLIPKCVIHSLVIFCSKKAYMYDSVKETLIKKDGLEHIYATGLMVCKRDKWLKRVERFQGIVKRRNNEEHHM